MDIISYFFAIKSLHILVTYFNKSISYIISKLYRCIKVLILFIICIIIYEYNNINMELILERGNVYEQGLYGI